MKLSKALNKQTNKQTKDFVKKPIGGVDVYGTVIHWIIGSKLAVKK